MLASRENNQNQMKDFKLKNFAEKVYKKVSYLYMARLDADSLFSNLLLNKSIDICIDSLCNENENTPKITKDVFRDFLNEVTE